MPTNENHELAANLRKYMLKDMNKRYFDVDEVFDVLNIDTWYDCERQNSQLNIYGLHRLCRLLDRKTCAIVESYMGGNLEYVEETPYHVLSCSHVAYGEDDPMFCPVCGAAVTDDYR